MRDRFSLWEGTEFHRARGRKVEHEGEEGAAGEVIERGEGGDMRQALEEKEEAEGGKPDNRKGKVEQSFTGFDERRGNREGGKRDTAEEEKGRGVRFENNGTNESEENPVS